MLEQLSGVALNNKLDHAINIKPVRENQYTVDTGRLSWTEKLIK